MLKGALFDLDGTLLDSTGVWEQIDIDFLAKRGFAVPDDYMKAVSSKTFMEAAVYTTQRFGLKEDLNDLCNEWHSMALEAYGVKVALKPGAADFLRALKAKGVRLGVVTGLPQELAHAALKHNGIYDLFDAFTSANEVPRGKEFPDVYHHAAAKLGLKAEECGVFEDVPACMESAQASGAQVFAVYDIRTNGKVFQGLAGLGTIPVTDFCKTDCAKMFGLL